MKKRNPKLNKVYYKHKMMFTQITQIKRPILLFLSTMFAVFVLLTALPATTSAANTKHDLCTGANLTFEKNAGCGKVRDGDNFRDLKDGEGAQSDINKLITRIINVVSIIVGIIAVIMVIYGGFRLVTSAGNPENTKTGRNAILYALVGLIIVAFAQTIVKFILNKLA